LAPAVQALRQLRDRVQEIEYQLAEKKKLYDAVMMGVDV
jgi:hypothetical protein